MSDFTADNPTSNGPGRFAPQPDAVPPAEATGEPAQGGMSAPAPPAPTPSQAPPGAPGPAHVAGSGPAHAAKPAGGRNGMGGSPPFPPARSEAGRQEPARPDLSRPVEVKGRIHIADEVVEKVAALAAIEVPGVADLGGDFERAIESVRERIGIGNKRGDQGVRADVKGHEVTVNVTVMVEYGHVVLDVARQVQANVARKTHRMLGLNVVEVNVTVDDVRTSRPEADQRVDDRA